MRFRSSFIGSTINLSQTPSGNVYKNANRNVATPLHSVIALTKDFGAGFVRSSNTHNRRSKPDRLSLGVSTSCELAAKSFGSFILRPLFHVYDWDSSRMTPELACSLA